MRTRCAHVHVAVARAGPRSGGTCSRGVASSASWRKTRPIATARIGGLRVSMRADLHRRGVRAQQVAVLEPERVLRVARRVVASGCSAPRSCGGRPRPRARRGRSKPMREEEVLELAAHLRDGVERPAAARRRRAASRRPTRASRARLARRRAASPSAPPGGGLHGAPSPRSPRGRRARARSAAASRSRAGGPPGGARRAEPRGLGRLEGLGRGAAARAEGLSASRSRRCAGCVHHVGHRPSPRAPSTPCGPDGSARPRRAAVLLRGRRRPTPRGGTLSERLGPA